MDSNKLETINAKLGQGKITLIKERHKNTGLISMSMAMATSALPKSIRELGM
jgi:hypothetical protein